MEELARNKIYFVSDAHLGADAAIPSREREKMLVEWLGQVQPNAGAIYFLGDLFDHWFEYNHVIPRGFSHFIGKLSELRSEGIDLYFFTGNHDMWMFGFFEKELDIPVYRKPRLLDIRGKRFFLIHGDGLPTDHWSNRWMKWVFAHPLLQWTFARLHPNFAIGLMKYLSRKSRLSHEKYDRHFRADREHMIDYAQEISRNDDSIDFILMGHRHLPIDLVLENGRTRYINLGDWIHHFSFAVFDGYDLKIQFHGKEHPVYPL